MDGLVLIPVHGADPKNAIKICVRCDTAPDIDMTKLWRQGPPNLPQHYRIANDGR